MARQLTRHAVITGGGSGIGRAVALRLAHEGWQVAVVGRRADALHETSAMASGNGIRVEPCDVVDAEAVRAVRERLADAWGGVDAVVASAGTNIARRALSDVTTDDFRHLIEVNLLGAFNVIHAFLPLMRGRPCATVVTVVSDAGLIANAKAGASYVASKFGLAGLAESINTELRAEGIRATAIFPGDTDTPLLDKRPAPPSADQRRAMLQPDDVADCVLLALTLPHRAVLEKLVIRPR